MARELKRLNMNMPSDLIDQVDEYAEKMNVNRSSAINMLVSTALEQKNAVTMMERMLTELQKVKVQMDEKVE